MFLTLHLHRTKVRDLAWDMVTRMGGGAEGAEGCYLTRVLTGGDGPLLYSASLSNRTYEMERLDWMWLIA